MKFLFLTCALCALILGVFASAAPNPDALANPEALPNPDALASPDALANPEAEPEADPEALPATIEVSGGEIEARQDEAGAELSQGEDLEKREPKPAPYPLYCWKGWNKKNFKGRWVQYCCRSRCCFFFHSIANHNLRSARATVSPRGSVKLWRGTGCRGSNKWLTFGGDRSMPGPGYYSMSLY